MSLVHLVKEFIRRLVEDERIKVSPNSFDTALAGSQISIRDDYYFPVINEAKDINFFAL